AAMPAAASWTAAHGALMLAMWAVMMLAMMLPSAAPMILLYANIERRRRDAAPFPATAVFAAGYVVVWLAVALAATALQWWLDRSALYWPAMAGAGVPVAAVTLTAVGIYQFTPWKHACLRNCRAPLEFISRYWGQGALAIGVRHGLFCLGCCGMLMLLLFVGGVMNMVWVALIAGYVLAEKTVPGGQWLSFGAGGALILWGGRMLYAGAAG
ncbi:MAG: DUF2182 domain-containing protein, partial [Proteobacteria bacterium]|nr:DUF2182 domain-containing protein [Pseudomonadota bacterium]